MPATLNKSVRGMNALTVPDVAAGFGEMRGILERHNTLVGII